MITKCERFVLLVGELTMFHRLTALSRLEKSVAP